MDGQGKRALWVDLDGVVRHWTPHDQALEQEFGLPAGSLRRIGFEPTRLHAALSGQLSDAQWRDAVREQVEAEQLSPRAAELVARWSAPIGAVDAAVLGLLRELRPQLRLVLASNATTRLPQDLRALGIHEDFDAVLNSSVLGYAKPDPRYFLAGMQATGLTRDQLALVDDAEANVRAAEALGIRAHHYNGVAGLHAFVQAWLHD